MVAVLLFDFSSAAQFPYHLTLSSHQIPSPIPVCTSLPSFTIPPNFISGSEYSQSQPCQKIPIFPFFCNMLSTFHIGNFRPWAFPPPTKSPSPTPYPPPARFPIPKQHPPSEFPRSHSPCNKSSAIKLCDEPRPRTLPLPKHPLPARPPADACVNTSAKGAPYTFSGSQLSPPQSPIP